MKILIVDDEPAIVEAISWNLRREGHEPLTAGDSDEALRKFRENTPDLVILDVMLPSGSGFDICRRLRQNGSRVPILMLTARIAESDRVFGLQAGADDYLIKPFGMRELMARVMALLRRGTPAVTEGKVEPAALFRIQVPNIDLVIDPERREARIGDHLLTLSRREFDLLALFAAHPGRVFDRPTLLNLVWGEDAGVDDRTVDVHIRWLREKIEVTPGSPRYLLTVRGVGYKLQAAGPVEAGVR